MLSKSRKRCHDLKMANGVKGYIILTGELNSDWPMKECPSPSRVVDLAVGRCGALVVGPRMAASNDTCL